MLILDITNSPRMFVCVHMCEIRCACLNPYLTCAPELLAFNLADAFVGQSSGMATAGSTGLNRVVKQVVCQPLQVTVTHKGILGQMTRKEREMRDGFVMGTGSEADRTVTSCHSCYCNILLMNDYFHNLLIIRVIKHPPKKD